MENKCFSSQNEQFKPPNIWGKLLMESFPLDCCWKKVFATEQNALTRVVPPILGDASNGMFWANAVDKVSAQVNGSTWENQQQNDWRPQIGKENHQRQNRAESDRLRGKTIELFGSLACYIGLGRVNYLIKLLDKSFKHPLAYHKWAICCNVVILFSF